MEADPPRRGHVVVFGDSRPAKAFAAQEATRAKVVHAGREPVPAGEGVEELALPADPDLAVALTGARDAATVFVDLADDASTIALVAAIVGLEASDGEAPGPRPQILANIRDRELRRTVDANLFAAHVLPRPRLAGTDSLAAGAAIAAARPHELAHWRGQARLHAVVLGFTALGRDCFEELVQAGIAGTLGKPRVTIVDPDPGSVRKLLDRDMPEIGESADVQVAAFDPLTLVAPDGPLAAAEAVAPLTLIVVALDAPGLATGAMLSLARVQEREGQAVASVLVLDGERETMLRLARPAGRPRDLARSWSVRGGVERDGDILDLLTHRSDSLAERIHEVYRARFGGSGPAGQAWADLPETYRRANRRAAAHLPLKLWTLGLHAGDGAADPFSVEPHAHASVVLPCARSTSEDSLLRRLSRLEHERWCAERRLDGWRFGEVRDDARRIHPKLIAFDDPRFTEEDIEKDADQVRFLFGTVVRPDPEGAASPLVVGVSTQTGERSAGGIAVEAALALCRREPWRPVVILSALVDDAECRLLAELDAAFSREGRAWRLIVPEVSRDNREIRIVAGEGERAALAAFLERPTTRFAPLETRAAEADLWADPSAPDPHLAAIAAYVAARASAIVDRAGEADAPGAVAAG